MQDLNDFPPGFCLPPSDCWDRLEHRWRPSAESGFVEKCEAVVCYAINVSTAAIINLEVNELGVQIILKKMNAVLLCVLFDFGYKKGYAKKKMYVKVLTHPRY